MAGAHTFLIGKKLFSGFKDAMYHDDIKKGILSSSTTTNRWQCVAQHAMLLNKTRKALESINL